VVITDASGNKSRQTHQTNFDDTRFDWKSINQGKIFLYWYRGSDSFAEQLMSAAQDALVKLANSTGAQLQSPVSIYIYASSQDMLGGTLFEPEWAGGINYTDYSVITIGIPTSQLAWGITTIHHELTHQSSDR